ncbi:SEL1-like repeat protein [Verrucomicrobium spinosum]|uniref:SEL1-like repeat protein n=1 Tax=Verrucomicrobium spinosum TaxID=2736 RepID=UPI0001745E47|nr:SEL1-like repeat protein [Verrucomicrobium spinosum]
MSPGEAHAALDLAPPFTREQLETAYHHALTFWHPSHFADDEAALAEAMNQTIRINEAYQFLLRPPGEEKSPLATARRLTLPTAPVLAEPKVEQIPPRILGPRLRLPPAPVVAASPAFTPVGQNRTNSGGSGVLTPRTPSGTASSFTPMPPPTAVRPAPAQVQPFRLTMPWMIGIGGVIALMIFWSFTQAGLTSRLRRPFFGSGAPASGDSRSFSASLPPRPTRLPAQFEGLYQRATENNDPVAQRKLGDNLRYSAAYEESERSQSTAWYRVAASQGDTEAQRQLGDAYRFGLGVAPDMSQAIAWYQKAASNGDSKAREALKKLKPQDQALGLP